MGVFTEDDLDSCWPHYKAYLLQILNGEYSLEAAREDLQSLIGSKFDERFRDSSLFLITRKAKLVST